MSDEYITKMMLMEMKLSRKNALTFLCVVLCAGLGVIVFLGFSSMIAVAANDEFNISTGWAISSYQDVNEDVYDGAKIEVFDAGGKQLGFYKSDFLDQVKIDGSGKGDGIDNSGQFLHYDYVLDDEKTYYLVNRSLGAYNNTLVPWTGAFPSIAINPPMARCTRIQFVNLGPDGGANPDWVISLLKNTTFYVDDKFTGVTENKIDIYVGLQKTKVMEGTPESLWMTDATVKIFPPLCAPSNNATDQPKSYNRLTVETKDSAGNEIPGTTIEIYDSNNILLHRVNSTTSANSKDLDSNGSYSIKYMMPSGDALVINNLHMAKNITLSPWIFNNYTNYTWLLPADTEPRSAAIALDDSEISGYIAEITLKLDSSEVNKILHCTNWNYSGASCSSWDSKPTSYYNAYSDGSRIKFNVTSFDAYMAGYAPATCSDGIRNQEETGIDCGGPCSACYTPPSNPPRSGGGGGGGGSAIIAEPIVKFNASAIIVPYPREFEIQPGQTDFKIIIENTGKIRINNISVEFNNTWFSPDSKRINLSAGESKIIPVNITVPESINPGQYTAKVFLKGGVLNYTSFNFTIPEKENKITALITQSATESARDNIDELKKRIQQSKSDGYNTTTAELFAAKADESYQTGAILAVSDYISKANYALDASIKPMAAEKKSSAPYLLVGGLVCILIISLIMHYRKEKTSATAENQEKIEENHENR